MRRLLALACAAALAGAGALVAAAPNRTYGYGIVDAAAAVAARLPAVDANPRHRQPLPRAVTARRTPACGSTPWRR